MASEAKQISNVTTPKDSSYNLHLSGKAFLHHWSIVTTHISDRFSTDVTKHTSKYRPSSTIMTVMASVFSNGLEECGILGLSKCCSSNLWFDVDICLLEEYGGERTCGNCVNKAWLGWVTGAFFFLAGYSWNSNDGVGGIISQTESGQDTWPGMQLNLGLQGSALHPNQINYLNNLLYCFYLASIMIVAHYVWGTHTCMQLGTLRFCCLLRVGFLLPAGNKAPGLHLSHTPFSVHTLCSGARKDWFLQIPREMLVLSPCLC